MIIQCEKCLTKFRLDDSRVTDKGVKVRCTKCKHVFTVQKEIPETGFSEAEGAFVSQAVQDEDQTDFGSFETSSYDLPAMSSAPDELLTAGTEKEPVKTFEAPKITGEVDFSGFDFGDRASESDIVQQSTLSIDDFTVTTDESAPLVTSSKEALQGLDFSDDDMFGAVVQSVPEKSGESISFDFEGDSFAESMDMNSADSSGTLFSLDAPFNLGEIDFGDELTSVAIQQVNPDDLKPSQENLFAPMAEAHEKAADDDLTRSFLGQELAGEQGELPPLSIASRRKRSPLFGALISGIAVLVISILGYIGYSSFYPSKEATIAETGNIETRAVKSVFVKNREAGELLVISGEALNGYSKPRAALQVKVTVFDASGQSVATKTAYCGNPLSGEQLMSLPLDKIEAAMANQFGDSLANMEVSPGKAVPFVVVIANLPKGAGEFSVQSGGSTAATGKQP